jgi:ribosomal protein S17E
MSRRNRRERNILTSYDTFYALFTRNFAYMHRPQGVDQVASTMSKSIHNSIGH